MMCHSGRNCTKSTGRSGSMDKVIVLFLAFTVTDPDGVAMDEQFHVMAKRFETAEKCTQFVTSWGGLIESRGVDKAMELIKDGYEIKLEEIGCVGRRVF